MNGTYNQFVNHEADFAETTQDGFTYVDFKFVTGPFEHKLTVGGAYESFYGVTPIDGSAIFRNVGNFSIYSPGINNAGFQTINNLVNGVAAGTEQEIPFSNFYHIDRLVGDDIKLGTFLGGSWELLSGANYASIGTKSYGFPSGLETGSYRRSAFSPTGSVIYKPKDALSFYATYIEGLEQGATVGKTATGAVGPLPVTNPGAQPPTIDESYEVGSKIRLGGALATVSLFRITKASDTLLPNPGSTSYTFMNAGKERHQGAEFELRQSDE